MDKWQKVKINEFLKERPDRIKPIEANTMGLKRVEKIDFGGNIYLSEKTTNTNMILVKSGDLVISGINVEKGALAVYEGEEDVLATIHYSSYEYDRSKIDVSFLKYFLISNKFKQILLEQTGSGIKTELKAKKFLALIVSIPDIEEQKVIVEKIRKVETEISDLQKSNTHSLELIAKLRQSILQEAVEGKLTADYRTKNETEGKEIETAEELLKKIKAEKEKLIAEGKIRKDKPLPPITEEEKPFELPQKWEWVRLGEICEPIVDGTHHTPKYIDSGIKFISAKNIINEKIDFSECKYISLEEHNVLIKRCNPSRNSLLITKSGTIGRVAIVNTDEEFSLFESVALIKPIDKNNLVDYLKYFLKNRFINNFNSDFVKGAAVKHLHLNMLRLVTIPLPPFEEQRQIVEKVDKLMAHCDELEKTAVSAEKESEMLMQSVLKEAFEG